MTPSGQRNKDSDFKGLACGLEHKKMKISSQNLGWRWSPYNQTSKVQLWDYVI